jgi:hypothetical protein
MVNHGSFKDEIMRKIWFNQATLGGKSGPIIKTGEKNNFTKKNWNGTLV